MFLEISMCLVKRIKHVSMHNGCCIYLNRLIVTAALLNPMLWMFLLFIVTSPTGVQQWRLYLPGVLLRIRKEHSLIAKSVIFNPLNVTPSNTQVGVCGNVLQQNQMVFDRLLKSRSKKRRQSKKMICHRWSTKVIKKIFCGLDNMWHNFQGYSQHALHLWMRYIIIIHETHWYLDYHDTSRK